MTPATTGFRSDIEGLRAVAVAIVLLYHARLLGFSGGYVGVDVFFVVSGFLITRLLVNEVAQYGVVRLGRFWARRARRLLPASILVIVATVVAGHWMLDPLTQKELSWDAVWSSLFSMNIALARRGQDYLREGLAPSSLRHYWSLSLEEQFYVVWPLIMVAAVAVRRRFGAALGWTVAAITVASLAASVVLTSRHPTSSYYLLHTRAWELAAGAAIALSLNSLTRLSPTVRAAAGWVGLGAIVASALHFTDRTSFPGWAAVLPVAGAAAVIAAGGTDAPEGPVLLLRAGALQWLGARSYAAYLWHWPALVLAEARYGPLSWKTRLAIVVGSVALAAVSYAMVENPLRHSQWLARRPPRSYAMGAGLIAAAVFAAAGLVAALPKLATDDVAAGAALVVPEPSTSAAPAGPAPSPAPSPATSPVTTPATDPESSPATTPATIPATIPATAPSSDRAALLAELDAAVAANQPMLAEAAKTTRVPANLRPSLRAVRGDKPAIYDNGCILDPGQATPRADCVFGDPSGAVTIVLYGDSHAAQWFPAMRTVAERRHWRLVVMTKKRCPSAAIPTVELTQECFTWRSRVVDALEAMQPDLVVMSGYRYRAAGWATRTTPDQAWARGLNDTLTAMTPHAKEILLLGDSPTPVDDIPSCLAGHVRNVSACQMTRDQATRPGRLAAERRVAADHGVQFAPTSDWLCTESRCPVVIGDVLAYRDDSHITSTAAALLTPYVDLLLRAMLAGD